MTQNEKSITERHFFDYSSYRNLIDSLLESGKTTGENHAESMIEYTKMNVVRMNRIDKTVKLQPELVEKLENLTGPQDWLVLTEAWCGDAAQIVPVIAKMAEISPVISLKLLLRDQNPGLMDQHLTNGGRAIPKLIAVSRETGKTLFTWGPRPAEAQDLFLSIKDSGKPFSEISNTIHTWYAQDKTLSVQREFLNLL